MKLICQLVIVFGACLVVGVACKDSIVVLPLSDEVKPPARPVQEHEKVFIVDLTGKRWDVTHAVNQYGFLPEKFEFGLGPDAIPPILEPRMLSPGEEGYPEDSAGFPVMGTEINGESRAYPLTVMSRHEIVDELFGEQHVAVAY